MSSIRRAARVLLIDPADRVLLLWHSRPGDDDHWAPPGGGIELEETPEQAAARELREEVGLVDTALRGPVALWQHRFSYHGVQTLQHETIFAARLDSTETPHGAPEELARDGITAGRWWSLPELAETSEDVWPHGLVDLLPDLLAYDLDPAQPIDLGYR